MNTQKRIKTVLTLAALAMAILGLPASPANAVVVDGLVEYWELDGDYSAEVDPTHVGTLTTTGTGSGTFVSGKFGQGIDLENSTDNQAFIVIGGDENDFDFAGGSMSVALWYTTESLYTSWQALAAKGESNAWRLHRQSDSATNINFVGGDTDARISGDGELDQQDGSWHHVVATADTVSGLKIYVDGSEVASGSTPVAIVGNTAAMQIGGNPGAAGRGWDGILDDVGVWNRVLTAEEVSAIWSGGYGRRIGSLDDPCEPYVNAGFDMITVSGLDVVLDPNVTNNDPLQPPLTYEWTDDNVGVYITENGTDPDNILTPGAVVVIPQGTPSDTVVTLILTVTRTGSTPAVDTMKIYVYENACKAKIAAGQDGEYDPGDLDENCITDLKDYAILAATWLVDYALTGPISKIPAVSTDKATYSVDETIVYSYSFAEGNTTDWIGIYEAGASNWDDLYFYYLNGETHGSIVENDPQLPVGSYEARLFFNDSYTLEAATSFDVQ